MRSILANLALMFVSVAVVYGGLEIGTRILWKAHVPASHNGVVMTGSGRAITHHGMMYRINEQGIRGADVGAKRVGEHRILLLGDSFVWGDGLVEEDTISHQMQKRLDAVRGGTTAINAGVSGFNTKDELDQLKRLAPVYDPDTVLLFFFTNDVLSVGNGAAARTSTSWKHNLKEFLRTESKFFAFIYYLYKDRVVSVVGVPQTLLAPDYFNLGDDKPGWVAFLRAFEEMRQYCAARHIGFAVVMIPTLTNLNAKYPFQELRAAVTSVLRASGTPFLDLFDEYVSYRPAELWVDLENTHWNGRATAIAADSLMKLMTSANLLPDRPQPEATQAVQTQVSQGS